MRPSTHATRPTLVWVGAALDPSGHADELRGFLRAQERAGDEPALRQLTWTKRTTRLSGSDTLMLERQARRSPMGPAVVVHQYLPHDEQLSDDSSVNVARAMFETDRLPAGWLEPLLQRDEVWVPCEQNRQAFAESGVPEDRLRIVGGTLDFDLFAPGAAPLDLGDAPDGTFTFVTNFDFSARKGWETLLRAWGRAFDADSGVRLVLKTGSFYRGDDHVATRIEELLAAEFGARRDRLAPIVVRTDVLDAEAMPGLYAAADCYVLASRGEGWGRPYMEAMAMGLPTIASAWGGNTEFMTPETSWLVEGELVPVPEDAELFNSLYQGHRWFEPDVDALADAMRAVAADPAAARAKAALARPDLLARFGPQATARTLRAAAAGAAERVAGPVGRRVGLRGGAGSGHSLAVVNDGLARGLEAAGHVLCRRAARDRTLDAAAGISHFWPPDFDAASHGANVVVLPWEFGAPPRAWVDQVRTQVDRVWVPSAYVRDRHVAAGMPAGIVEVVPNGVDLERFTPEGDAAELAQGAGCTFLFVGGTTWRKGADLLLEAWRAAFGPEDDVRLVIKDFGTGTFYKGQTAGERIAALAADPQAAPVTYLDEDLPATALPALYRAADAVVLPYRGEGFCLPALEAMACGVPVLHTATGPTAEFVGPDCGWALPATQVAIPAELVPEGVEGDAHVQEVDHDALVATLRAVAADADERRRRGAAARAAALRYSWEAAGAVAQAALDGLLADDLPVARSVRPSRVEGHATMVLYAPDWADAPTWTATLTAWATTVGAADPVTLALFLGDGDADAITARVMACLGACGVADDALPDLALCTPDRTLLSLAMGADAVLADPGDARPELVRRAAHVVTGSTDEISGWRAGIADGAPIAVAA